MKKIICLATLSLLSTPAFASKARLEALQKAAFLKDVQTTFINPAHVNSIGKLMTVEFGGSTNTAAPKAEGGIFSDALGANMGLYLGHISADQQLLRSVLGGHENQNNPIEVFYAKNNWGASLAVSNFDDKTAKAKEQSVTARFGIDQDGTEIFATVEALANAENSTDEYTGGPQLNLGYEKAMGDNYLFANFNWGMAENKVKAGGKTDGDVLGGEVGMLSRRLPNMYYGASLSYAKLKTTASITALTLPIFIGIEANLNSWAVLRASIVQSVLISSTQDKTATAPANAKIVNKNDTSVAAGLGVKYNKFTLDGVLSASTTGDVNGNAILSQASLTYEF